MSKHTMAIEKVSRVSVDLARGLALVVDGPSPLRRDLTPHEALDLAEDLARGAFSRIAREELERSAPACTMMRL